MGTFRLKVPSCMLYSYSWCPCVDKSESPSTSSFPGPDEDEIVSDPEFADEGNQGLQVDVSSGAAAERAEYNRRMGLLLDRMRRHVITHREREEFIYNIARDPVCAGLRSRTTVPRPVPSYGPSLPWPNPDKPGEVEAFFDRRREVISQHRAETPVSAVPRGVSDRRSSNIFSPTSRRRTSPVRLS